MTARIWKKLNNYVVNLVNKKIRVKEIEILSFFVLCGLKKLQIFLYNIIKMKIIKKLNKIYYFICKKLKYIL